jgi:hypothetical protein
MADFRIRLEFAKNDMIYRFRVFMKEVVKDLEKQKSTGVSAPPPEKNDDKLQ